MVVKDKEDFLNEDEFFPPDTSYKETKRIMLTHKFENFFNERVSTREADRLRLDEMNSKVNAIAKEKRINTLEKKEPMSKQVQGEFHYLLSKDKIKEDAVINSHELITKANEKPLSILIIGKPRSGKSKTAQVLSEALDLVHITTERWINALLKKIKEHEEPEDLEEGQEAPKWLTEFEGEMNKILIDGKGPDDTQILTILTE
jgi:hypothetical protein